jgi:hypothetical protein
LRQGFGSGEKVQAGRLLTGMNLSQRRNSFPARGDEKRQKNPERHDYSTPCGLAGEMALSQRSAGSVHKSRITRLGKILYRHPPCSA